MTPVHADLISPLRMCESKSYKITFTPESVPGKILLSDNYTLVVCDGHQTHRGVHKVQCMSASQFRMHIFQSQARMCRSEW